MDEMLQALGIPVVKELLLEVRDRLPVRVGLAGLGGGTLGDLVARISWAGGLGRVA
jgi:hypothetical protein